MILSYSPQMEESLHNYVKKLSKEVEFFISSIFLSKYIDKKSKNIKNIKDMIYLYDNSQKEITSFKHENYKDKSNNILLNNSSSLSKIVIIPEIELENVKSFLMLFENEKKFKELYHELTMELLSSTKGMQNYNEEFINQLNELFIFSNNHVSKKNAFYYHYNNFYRKNENEIILTNQNFEYLITKKNEDIHIIIKNEKLEPTEALDNHFVLSKDGEDYALSFLKLDQPFVLYHFMLDLNAGVKDYKMINNIIEEVNPIVKSYDYWLAHYFKNNNLSKENIIWRIAFYSLHKKVDSEGNLAFDAEILPHNKKTELLSKTIFKDIKRTEFDIPCILEYEKIKTIFNSIKNVNDSWKLFFIDLHECIESFINKYETLPEIKKQKYTSFYKNKDSFNFIETLKYCSTKSKEIGYKKIKYKKN